MAALAIAVPLGIVIGYTGRGEALIAGFANALRALPSLGLLVLLFLIISPVVTGKTVYVLPTIIVLVLLAVPPILTGTYAGIQNADPDAVGAARGMGFTKRQILLRVQLPCALPPYGLRSQSSTLQIISTATIAAYLGLQGLGRFILDGRATATSAKWPAVPYLSLFSQSFSSSASPGSANHRVAGSAAHRREIHLTRRHDRPRTGRHLGVLGADHHIRRNIMKKHIILSALAVTSVLALSACGGGGDPLRQKGTTPDPRVRRSSSVPPTSPRVS